MSTNMLLWTLIPVVVMVLVGALGSARRKARMRDLLGGAAGAGSPVGTPGGSALATPGASGLRVVMNEGGRSRSEGTYRGHQIVLETDASETMSVMRRQAAGGVARGIGNMLLGAAVANMGGDPGVVGIDNNNTGSGRAAFQARMRMSWSVVLPAPAPARVEIRRQPAPGDVPIGPGLHARFDQQAQAALASPAVQAALGRATFDLVSVDGTTVCVSWSPTNAEYGQFAQSGRAMTLFDEEIGAAIALADALTGSAATT